jgi:hypothetical protein
MIGRNRVTNVGVGAGALLMVLTLSPGSSFAETAKASGAAAVDAVKACRAIAAPDARLACFDKTSAALDEAITNHEVTVLDKQEVRRTRRSLFGFEMPHIALFDAKDEKEQKSAEYNELDSNVTAVHSLGYGKFEVVIAEGGAVWRNSDAMDFPPKVGDKIHIKKGVIGNYFLKIGTNQVVRGSRAR